MAYIALNNNIAMGYKFLEELITGQPVCYSVAIYSWISTLHIDIERLST